MVSTDPAISDPRRLASVRATGLLDTAPEEEFDQLARLACRVLDTPYAFVTLVDDERSFWKACIGVAATDPADRQNRVEESFCQYVVRTAEPLIVGDVTVHPITKDNPSIDSMGVRAWAGHPIHDETGQVLGTMCAVDVETRTWSDDDSDLLRLLADSASNVMQLRTALSRTEEHAHEMRQSLLPPTIPLVPAVDVAAIHRSAGGRDTVMGDFYDVFRSSRDRWHVVIGDVCGRGTEAAKFTSLVRWSYQASADHKNDPAEIFESVNEVLRRQPDARFVTGQAISFSEPDDGMLRTRFASAGHHPALIRRADGAVEQVVENGWMLGMFDPYEIQGVDVTLHPGDQLVLFTDGVPEARRGGRLLGPEAIESAVASFVGDVYELAHSLVELADGFADAGSDDDVAVVVIAPQVPAS